MPDRRFFHFLGPVSLADACEIAGARLVNSATGNEMVERVAGMNDADLEGAVVFLTRSEHAQAFSTKRPSLALIPQELQASMPAQVPMAICDDPKRSFALLAAALHASRNEEKRSVEGTKSSASHIDATAVISKNVEMGDDVHIGAFACIGPGVRLGDGTRIGAHAIVSHAIIGARCVIGPGAVIGEAGFGFVVGENGLSRVPQLGRVVIHDDVEIGANSSVDRGALGDTEIGAGTKIDNLVQIAHNVKIGRSCVIAAQVGIAGSVVVGDGVMIGGQVGIADHMTIGDGAQLGARAGVMRSVPPKEAWGGYPAKPVRQWLREVHQIEKASGKKRKEK